MLEISILQTFVVFFVLVIFSVIDLMEHRIPKKGIVIAGIVVIAFKFIEYTEKYIKEIKISTNRWDRYGMVSLGVGVGIGLLFLLISKVTEERIGYGDSWLILILGTAVGGRRLVELLAGAFFLLCITGIVVLAAGKKRRDVSIPFVPFLLVGYVWALLLEGGIVT